MSSAFDYIVSDVSYVSHQTKMRMKAADPLDPATAKPADFSQATSLPPSVERPN
jgi:hypothetical protein